MTRIPNPFRVLLVGVSMVAGLFAWSGPAASPAAAHEGHAGKMQTFLDTKLALRQMLPAGDQVVRRKEALSEASARWVKETLGVAVDADLYSFFLAKDASGAVTGVAMVAEFEYGHGEVSLALGLDPRGRVTQAAVLGIHEAYLPDLMRSTGKGILPGLAGLDVAGLAARAGAVNGDDQAGKVVMGRLRDMAAVLAGLDRQVRS